MHLISCPKCKGRGKITLNKTLQRGLDVLGSKKSVTLAEYSNLMVIELSNAHHLMRRLVQAGVAEKLENTRYPAKYRATKKCRTQPA